MNRLILKVVGITQEPTPRVFQPPPRPPRKLLEVSFKTIAYMISHWELIPNCNKYENFGDICELMYTTINQLSDSRIKMMAV